LAKLALNLSELNAKNYPLNTVVVIEIVYQSIVNMAWAFNDDFIIEQ